jgi:hypothetical protein
VKKLSMFWIADFKTRSCDDVKVGWSCSIRSSREKDIPMSPPLDSPSNADEPPSLFPWTLLYATLSLAPFISMPGDARTLPLRLNCPFNDVASVISYCTRVPNSVFLGGFHNNSKFTFLCLLATGSHGADKHLVCSFSSCPFSLHTFSMYACES